VKAEAHLARAAAIQREHLGAQHADTLATLTGLCSAVYAQDRPREATQLGQAVVDGYQQLYGPADQHTLGALARLAEFYSVEKPDKTREILRRVASINREQFGDDHPWTMASNNALAIKLGPDAFTEAEALLLKSLEYYRKRSGTDSPEYAGACEGLGWVYLHNQRFADAERYLSDALAWSIKVRGPDHDRTVHLRNTLTRISPVEWGDHHLREGRYEEALVEFNRAVAARPGSDGWYIRKRRAVVHFHMGNYVAALADVSRAVEMNPADGSNLTWINPTLVAACRDDMFRQGMLDLATRAVERTYGAPDVFAARAELYAAMNEDDKARADRAMAIAGYERLVQEVRAKTGPDPLLLVSFGKVLLLQGRFNDAEPILRECLDIADTLPDRWERYYAKSILGGVLSGQKRYAEAEPLLLEGYEGMRARTAKIRAGSSHLADAAVRLVELYTATGSTEKAEEWRKKLAVGRETQKPKP
jgi:tetratricopeptide (TPR) repeat protein